MRIDRASIALLLLPAIAACTSPVVATPTFLPLTRAPAPTPTITSEEVHLPPAPLGITEPAPEDVAFDFVGSMCEAEWANNTRVIPCPGDPSNTTQGYVARVDGAPLEGGATTDQQALLTIPASGPELGIFGAYPPLTIETGDRFRAGLACEADDEPCEVAFGLAYYDENGVFLELPAETGPVSLAMHNESGASFTPVDVSLDALAGRTVRLVLIVRPTGDTAGGRALWIRPFVFRPASAYAPEAFGGFSGMVDMASAPPYLNDPIVTGGLGSPVVVVAFNLDNGTFWWVDTTATHPEFTITVPAGRYHLAAYGQGVADVPYVVGGYTGLNPSCGEELLAIDVSPDHLISGIEIADWNWTCGGTAYRPEKPPDVPIP